MRSFLRKCILQKRKISGVYIDDDEPNVEFAIYLVGLSETR